MEISILEFVLIVVFLLVIGSLIGYSASRDYVKCIEKEYEKKHNELYNTVRKETRNEWHNGWSAAYKSVGDDTQAYYKWFQEHGYDPADIEDWYKEYLNNEEDK